MTPNNPIMLNYNSHLQKWLQIIMIAQIEQEVVKITWKILLPSLTDLRSSKANFKAILKLCNPLRSPSSSFCSLSLSSSNKGLKSFTLLIKFPYIFRRAFLHSGNPEISLTKSTSWLTKSPSSWSAIIGPPNPHTNEAQRYPFFLKEQKNTNCVWITIGVLVNSRIESL